METKICAGCKVEKKLEEFNLKARSQDGRQPTCRVCNSNAKKKHYEANKADYIAKAKERKKVITEWFEEYRSHLKCEDCPENHPAVIDFHHIDGDEKEVEISRAVHNSWSIEKIKCEISKCRILCSNCHRKLHWQMRNMALSSRG
jgi:hypothetical protein